MGSVSGNVGARGSGTGCVGEGRVHRGDGTAHVPPSHEGTLHMGNNPCRLAAYMV